MEKDEEPIVCELELNLELYPSERAYAIKVINRVFEARRKDAIAFFERMCDPNAPNEIAVTFGSK